MCFRRRRRRRRRTRRSTGCDVATPQSPPRARVGIDGNGDDDANDDARAIDDVRRGDDDDGGTAKDALGDGSFARESDADEVFQRRRVVGRAVGFGA